LWHSEVENGTASLHLVFSYSTKRLIFYMVNNTAAPQLVNCLNELSLQDKLAFIEYWLNSRGLANIDEGIHQFIVASSPFNGENFAIPGLIYRSSSAS
jgi:hypothetical protein